MMQECQEEAITGRASREGAPSSRETQTRKVRPIRSIKVDPAQMIMRRMILWRSVKRRASIGVSAAGGSRVPTSVTPAIVTVRKCRGLFARLDGGLAPSKTIKGDFSADFYAPSARRISDAIDDVRAC